MKIAPKLLSAILGVLLLGAGVSTYLTTNITKNALEHSITGEQQALIDGAKSEFESRINAMRLLLLQASNSVYISEVLKSPTDKKLVDAANARLKQVEKELPNVMVFGVIGANGIVVASSVAKNAGTQNLADREYFKQAMQGKFIISQPSISRTTNSPAFFMASPVLNEAQKVVGVMYMTVDLTAMGKQVLEHIKIGQRGYTFMMAPPGKTLFHPDPKRIFEDTSSFPWVKELFALKRGVYAYHFAGKDRLSAVATSETTGWALVLSAETDDVLSDVIEVRNAGLMSAAGMILLVALVTFFMVRSVTQALGRAVGVAEAVAAGDLSQDSVTTRKDEVGTLRQALHKMVLNLRTMIETAETKTREAEAAAQRAEVAVGVAEKAQAEAEGARRAGLLEAASRLEVIVTRVVSASEQLSSQIEEARRGAEVQRERVSETATAMEEMNATVLAVAKNAVEAATATDSARNEATQGSAIVNDVVGAINNVYQGSKEVTKKIAHLGDQATSIGQVMGVISDIADQTNLLALNAAIEAARAGDAGRGFAVVADEVRKLAEKTMTATKEVGSAIHAIQGGTDDAVKAVQASGDAIEHSTELVDAAGKALSAIVSMVEGSSDQVRAIAAASEQQSAASEEISRGTDEINRIAAETADTMQQSSQAVVELAHMAQELNTLVEDLKK